MSLKRKLARRDRLFTATGGEVVSGVDDKQLRVAKLRSALDEVTQRTSRRRKRKPNKPTPRYDTTLPGARTSTEHGPLHLIDEYFEPNYHHGAVPIADCLQVRPEIIAELALDEGLREVDFGRALFIDTETTGLAGGTGTLPFLIGMAFFEDGVLRMQQLFLPEPGQERPMLERFAAQLAQSSCLVSFNGKSFDWPLLRTRLRLNRFEAEEAPLHLDLLHVARRLFKKRLDSLRLVALERELLRMFREDDVDGALIPWLYLEYLDGGPVAPLVKVIEHNRHDLAALAALLAKIGDHYAEVSQERDPRDHLACAQLAERAGSAGRARAFALEAAKGDAGASSVDALLLAARLARRRGEYEEEARLLTRALQIHCDEWRDAQVHLALAKLYEHRFKDPARALQFAHKTVPAEASDAAARRQARLARQLDREAP